MRKASASLFVGLTIFVAGALIEAGCLSGNEALAASRGFSPSISQGRTATGGYRPGSLSQTKGTLTDRTKTKGVATNYPGNRRSGASFKTNAQKAKGAHLAGMGGNASTNWTGQRRTYTGKDLAPKGRADQTRTGRPIY